eukprot:769271-Alexandrium_andersonii.AAC.1
MSAGGHHLLMQSSAADAALSAPRVLPRRAAGCERASLFTSPGAPGRPGSPSLWLPAAERGRARCSSRWRCPRTSSASLMPARCASRRSISVGGRPASMRLRRSGSARACRTA